MRTLIDDRKRQLLKGKIALLRIRQSNDAISEIIDVLAKLPDVEMRRSVIDYLHMHLHKEEGGWRDPGT